MKPNYNERSRAIKRILVPEFGRENVSVRKDTGTAFNWVIVKITLPQKQPKSLKEKRRRELEVRGRVEELIKKAGIKLSGYFTDYGLVTGDHWNDCLLIEVYFSS